MAVPKTLRSAPLPLDDDKTAELADMFKMLGDPSRLRIVVATLDGPRAVGDIAAALGLSVSLVSHHLRLLRGKQIFYRVHDAHVAHVIADMIAPVNEEAE